MIHPPRDYTGEQLVVSGAVVAATVAAGWLIRRIRRTTRQIVFAMLAGGIILMLPQTLVSFAGIDSEAIPYSVAQYSLVAGMLLFALGLVFIRILADVEDVKSTLETHQRRAAALSKTRLLRMGKVQACVFLASFPAGAGLGIYWIATESGFYRWFVNFQVVLIGHYLSGPTDELTFLVAVIVVVVAARALLMPWDPGK